MYMIKVKALALTVLLSLLFIGNASAEGETLKETDNVAISFWIATAMMLASTAFFLIERSSVAPKWRTSMTVAALVTGVAWYHYSYMRTHWVETGESPLVLRYVDWLITVPLQVSEFYLILAAVGVASITLFWRLACASVIMLVFGFLGESGAIDVWLGFAVGMLAWAYIIYEIWMGDAKEASMNASKGTQFAFRAMALILTVGWAIYPLGYIFGYMAGGVDPDALNIIYNLADFINKIAFGLIIWVAAVNAGGRSR